MDPDVGPDLDPNCLMFMSDAIPEFFSEKVVFLKKSADNNKHAKLLWAEPYCKP